MTRQGQCGLCSGAIFRVHRFFFGTYRTFVVMCFYAIYICCEQKQVSSLCGQHCLNNLVQGAHYTAPDLADIAHELDAQERQHMLAEGVDTPEALRSALPVFVFPLPQTVPSVEYLCWDFAEEQACITCASAWLLPYWLLHPPPPPPSACVFVFCSVFILTLILVLCFVFVFVSAFSKCFFFYRFGSSPTLVTTDMRNQAMEQI